MPSPAGAGMRVERASRTRAPLALAIARTSRCPAAPRPRRSTALSTSRATVAACAYSASSAEARALSVEAVLAPAPMAAPASASGKPTRTARPPAFLLTGDICRTPSVADRLRVRVRPAARTYGLAGFFDQLVVARLVLRRLGDERGLEALLDRLLGHDALLDVAAGGQLELHVEQCLLEDRAQTARAGLAVDRLVGDRLERLVGEDELDVVELEEALELLDQRVLGLGEDLDQVVLRELVDDRQDRKTADELGDQAVLHEVLGEHLLEGLAGVLVVLRGDLGPEADALVADPPLDDLVQVGERAAADEQDVRRVDRQELLVRVLAATLRRDRSDGALQDLQQRLLDAFTRHVARDRRVVGLARDLVDLVDVDDPGLGLLHVEVGGLDQLEKDVLDVLADVARLGQRGGVRDRERHVQDLGQRLGQQRLAAAGRAEQQDVGLLQLEVLFLGLHHLHALVVVVDGDGERALGRLLADDVLLQDRVDLLRLRQVLDVERAGARELLVDDLVAEIDALVADVDAGAGDQLLHLALRLSAEAAEKLFVGVGGPSQKSLLPRERPERLVLGDHTIDESVVLRLFGAHEVVPLGIPGHLFQVLAAVVRQDLVQAVAHVDDLLGVDLDVGGLALEGRGHLVDQDLRVGQRHALARRAARQEQRPHRHRDADADGLDVRLDELHRVVDREARVHRPAGRVDVDRDVLVRVLGLQVQQLRDDQVGDLVGDRRPQEHDPLVEQARVDVERTLTSRGLLDDHRDKGAHCSRFISLGRVESFRRVARYGDPPRRRSDGPV